MGSLLECLMTTFALASFAYFSYDLCRQVFVTYTFTNLTLVYTPPPTPGIPLSTECCRVTSVNIYTDILYIQYVRIYLCMYHIKCTVCVK
jgi:hypothetical protein